MKPKLFLTFSRRALLLGGAALGCSRRAALPDLGRVPAFSLTDQSGRAVTQSSLHGGPWAAAFFFTRCPTICPRITRRMRELQLKARERRTALRLVSFSVDPENDTPEVLMQYARRFEADLQTWSFLTGDFAVVSRTAVDGFKLALEGRADAGAADFGILHGSHLVLVDGDSKIRGYYRTDDESELLRLLKDAEALQQ